jgi:hypothetical protein
MQSSQDHQETAKKKKVSSFALFLIVVALIAAGFGTGALLVFLRFRTAEKAWLQEKAGIEATFSTQATELAAVKSRETLWRLYEGMSTVYIELSEKNFGLARDEAIALTGILAKNPIELDADTKSKLAPIMADIVQKAEALDSEAKNKAREAREILRKIVGP